MNNEQTIIQPPATETSSIATAHLQAPEIVASRMSSEEEIDLDSLTPQTVSEEPAAPVSESEESKTEPAPRLVHAEQDYETTGALSSGTPDRIAIPPASEKAIMHSLNRIPQGMKVTESQRQKEWAFVLEDSLKMLPMEDRKQDRMAEEGSTFKQHVEMGGQTYRGMAPKVRQTPGVKELEGERALIQLVTHLGVGGLFLAPMWNSGFWVTFKPATETELLELNRLIYSDKIQLGRWSYGLALSNNIVYSLDHVFEFALRHVYTTSVKSEEMPIQDIRKWLAPQDLDSFIWGFLCANYPSGFHYETACIEDPTKCNHVIEENLNVTKLQWVDNNGLTEWQKQHMSSRLPDSKSLDSIKKYQEERARMNQKRILLNQGTSHELALTIKTPTIVEYVEQGYRWVSDIVNGVNAVLEESASSNERNALINKISKASILCQYVHWVDSIEYGELTPKDGHVDEQSRAIITDRTTIENLLKTLSATDSIREEITEAIIEYINHSTVTVIGVPAYDCPACGKAQEGDAPKKFPRHTSVIPLDLLQVFFALLRQRLGRIETRLDR